MALAHHGLVAAGFLFAASLAPSALAQTPGAGTPGPQVWSPPRTSDGRPDLQGDWTNSSITLLERTDPALPLVLTADQVKRLEGARAVQFQTQASRTHPEEGAPRAGGAVGGYNNFWMDRGSRIGVVNGQSRSSWIVDPPSGKLPFSDQGRARIQEIFRKRGEDGPEGMNPADRCLVGSRGSGGPPMLNNMYNNTYQIVQTPGHVVIDVEMMHDARIIRLGQAHKPVALSQWLGDSVGHWEGDTLVVETRNWKSDHGMYEPVFLSADALVTERFTRTGPDEITYAFTVADPFFYTQTWSGEMTLSRASGPVYEYACHEGNYALHGILSGARVLERKGAGQK